MKDLVNHDNELAFCFKDDRKPLVSLEDWKQSDLWWRWQKSSCSEEPGLQVDKHEGVETGEKAVTIN